MTRTRTPTKRIAATDYDVEVVDHSTTHTYQEPTSFQGVDDAPSEPYMDNGKEDVHLHLLRPDTAGLWVQKK